MRASPGKDAGTSPRMLLKACRSAGLNRSASEAFASRDTQIAEDLPSWETSNGFESRGCRAIWAAVGKRAVSRPYVESMRKSAAIKGYAGHIARAHSAGAATRKQEAHREGR